MTFHLTSKNSVDLTDNFIEGLKIVTVIQGSSYSVMVGHPAFHICDLGSTPLSG